MSPTPDTFPERRRICAVCGHTLDFYSWTDGSAALGWEHNSYDLEQTTIDHPPIPVSPGDVPGVPRCDFCLIGEVGYRLPAESFVIAEPQGGFPGHGSDGDWAACPECGTLIKAAKWNLLVERVWNLSPHRGTLPKYELTTGYRVLFANLRKHITGDLIPTN